MTRTDTSHILLRLKPSPIRRVTGVAMLVAFGAMAALAGLEMPADRMPLRIGLPLVGMALLWMAWRTWQATARGLELTPRALREGDGGRVLVELADIVSVDNSAIALFKPAGGFVITLSRPAPVGWAPGLWWRLGRRLGVGGTTARVEAKAMAAMLSELVRRRNG
ncbi:hypothetical protein SAMN05421774_101206 [Gemmobacter megaterium]|uniref:PH domain-containing protein n=1 Tax=Gemmobacter megaterium TaxID=1086013 RepID=A0A1N7K3S9_9RHOB|nr:hypothetical protein [Gemmobacter megaterium]GGE00297.1 hypothetical protein GCM10011345_02010 [Gemmobacter megaterium]SIS56255.1 hypothetical protein SAMN05421774_101206 [Gemmobacter megaterium]